MNKYLRILAEGRTEITTRMVVEAERLAREAWLKICPASGMTEQEKIADYWADWLIDAVGMATQNRALLRGDPAEDEVLTQAIVLNGKKAILSAMKALANTSTDRGAP